MSGSANCSPTARRDDPRRRHVDARTAESLGLVDRYVPDSELDQHDDDLAAEIAANSPGTNRIVK